MAPFDVVSVEVLPERRLAVQFADGLSGEVAIRDSHLFGVFAALKDPALFKQVHCAEGFVAWPGDIDLAPDAIYEAIKARGICVLE
jgi:hypothetical protein